MRDWGGRRGNGGLLISVSNLVKGFLTLISKLTYPIGQLNELNTSNQS